MVWQDLVTNRLHLRALRVADAGPIALYAGDARVARMTDVPHPYPPGAAEAYIARAREGVRELVWALDASASGGADFVGVIGFRPETRTMGYWIGPPFWGQGFASEAVQALSDHLLSQDAEVVHASAMAENCASRKVLSRAAFVPTGRSQRFSVARDAAVETVTYQKRPA